VDTKVLRGDFEPDMPAKPFQPFLRFNVRNNKIMNSTSGDVKFQPFLRFNIYGSARGPPPSQVPVSTLLEILPEFIMYMRVEVRNC
jgi:hypothetical protein